MAGATTIAIDSKTSSSSVSTTTIPGTAAGKVRKSATATLSQSIIIGDLPKSDSVDVDGGGGAFVVDSSDEEE